MNIFAVSPDPRQAARDLCDQHVVKMVLESAQILCTVAHRYGVPAPYEPTHRHHPCVLWAGDTRDNVAWLTAHGLALAEEYTRRYGKTHKSQRVIVNLAMPLQLAVPEGPLTPHAQAMPERYRGTDAVAAYRRYYAGEKQVFPSGKIATWRAPGVRPGWLDEYGECASTPRVA